MSSLSCQKLHPADAPDDFDVDDDLEETRAGRTSEDVRMHDRETLTAEEEAEKFLGGQEKEPSKIGKIFGRNDEPQQRRQSRRSKRRRQNQTEKRELMYEMEEGGPRSSSAESIASSSENDFQRLGEVQARARRKTSRTKRFGGITLIHLVIIATFLALLYGAYRATSHSGSRQTVSVARTLSNGTHIFAPTTVMLSLDGFRADFLSRGITPTLNEFIRSGVSPKYMMPSFPSLTFPNHFTLVTGLHPESHGVVGNTFWDPNTRKEFYYTDPARSMQPEWWNAEPIWLRAEKQGLKTAIHMWPGSEAHIGELEPEYVDEFNAHELLDRKVQRVLGWLDMPGADDLEHVEGEETRPQLIAAYVPNVDQDGHKYGPNSTYIRSTIAEVDGMLGTLVKGIEERNLTKIVNVIVVSDHGMATTSTQRLLQLEDLIDTKLIEHIDGWPLYGLRPYKNDEAHIVEIYNRLWGKSQQPEYKDAFDVYLRDKTMPERFHFQHNDRIAPIWIVPRAGWAIVTKEEFDVAKGKKSKETYSPKGLHGYDHEHPLMRAIFAARGPAFPHPEGSRVQEFQNTEVYNILCDSLGIEPQPNNGTLRLPFKPKGLHDFDTNIDVPEDMSADDDGDTSPPVVPNLNQPHAPTPSHPSPSPPTSPIPPKAPQRPERPDHPDSQTPERPVVHDGNEKEKELNSLKAFWEWIKTKAGEVKWWASEKLGWQKQDKDKESKEGEDQEQEKKGKDEDGKVQQGG